MCSLIQFVCLCLSATLIKTQYPLLFDSRPPPPANILGFGPALGPPLAIASAPIVAQTQIVDVPLPPLRALPVVQQAIDEPEIIGAAEPFAFNFDVRDGFGNGQHRKEEGDARGAVRGSYGYTDALGLYRVVDYIADKDGFRANVRSNEPGLVEEPANPADIVLAAEKSPPQVTEYIRNIKPYVKVVPVLQPKA